MNDEERLARYERQKIRTRRSMRESQQRGRAAGLGLATRLENALMVLAWEAGEISEGVMAKVLKMGRIEVRTLRADLIAEGTKIAEALHEPHMKRAIREIQRKEKLRKELEKIESEALDHDQQQP